MADLIDGLEEAIHKHCADAMRDHHNGDVDAMELRSVVQNYVTWRCRFPSVRPRKVHESVEFVAQADLRERYSPGLAALKRDIELGADLRPYLSKRVWKAHGRDRLFAHQGIHHLHLEPGGSEHVLFVVFRPEDAYLVAIYAHESDGANWSERAILEVLARNWDGAGVLHAMPEGYGLTQDYDDDDRLQLQLAGVNVALMIDGRAWHSLGASLMDDPRDAVRIGMEVGEVLRYWRAEGEEALVAELHAISAEQWQPAIYQGQYGYYAEGISGFVPFGTLDPP